jgi:HEAT repeat protein
MLSLGDLRSDGRAPEAADLIRQRPESLPELLAALEDPDPTLRGHAADALQRVARDLPSRIEPYLARLLTLVARDDVAMVRWHLAMVLTWITRSPATARRTIPALLARLDDPSAFVRAWSVSGLCVLGRVFGGEARILAGLRRLESDRSIAVRHRAAMARRLLTDRTKPLPESWLKVPARRNGALKRRRR